MPYREAGVTECEIRQPGFETRDLPVLNHCFIKKAVREMDYFGQQQEGLFLLFLAFPITHYPHLSKII
jgi:hypothetical protein